MPPLASAELELSSLRSNLHTIEGLLNYVLQRHALLLSRLDTLQLNPPCSYECPAEADSRNLTVHTFLLQQIPAMGNEEEASNESPPCKKKALDALFGDSFTQRERKTASETARAEVIRYRAKDAWPLTENAMKWWRSQEKELPLLRVFSTAGDIVNAQRTVLRPDYVDQLAFLEEKSVVSLKSSWLHLILNISALLFDY
ncbi:hypothetical protein INR49_031997 [Caranx melampygus]|nr:hypothetical protein INR49_031997 [Caranx melampygus]